MDNYVISDKDFKLFADLVYNKTGINLFDGNKKQLLQSRVNKLLRKREIPTYREYYDIVANDHTGDELMEFINLISTNVTNFFREPKHFDFMKQVWFPNFNLKHSEAIKIWCAASSSGEEPYTLSITMYELVGDNYNYDIFASDISTKVLKIAKKGIYPMKAVEEMDHSLVKKYFQQGSGNASGFVKVKSNIQRHVRFDKLNLIENFTHPCNYDLIFCRNVMIYFDAPTKQKIVNRFFDFMNKGAYLMIGHSESLNGIKHPFQYVQPATYRKA
jgi:chemotaxis protein methyltransferase CheR